MALPSLEKTYEFLANQSFGGEDSINDHRKGLLAIKDALISGSFTAPWTVAGSSDATTGGMDAVDRWSLFTDLSWGETDVVARSWIVFETTGGRQLLVECRGSGGTSVKYLKLRSYNSAGGLFTGGSSTARPTATDEQRHLNIEDWLAGQTTAQAYKFHVIKSTDGENTFLLGNHCH